MTARDWFRSFFGVSGYPLLGQIEPARTRAELRFLRRALGLRKGAAVLDAPCGAGRHSLGLARMGMEVEGFDLSASYLAAARRAAKEGGLRVRWRRGDLRRLPYRGGFDAAACLFTSFGYFPEPDDDLKVLRGFRRALEPGGRLLMDALNRAHFAGGGRRREEGQCWAELPGWLALERYAYLPRPGGVFTDWIFVEKRGGARGAERAGEIRRGSSFVRAFTRDGLVRLLRRAGFRPRRFWGDLRGARFAARGKRIVALAEAA